MKIVIVGSKGPHLAAVEAAASHFGETTEYFEEHFRKGELTKDIRQRQEDGSLVIAVKCHYMLPVVGNLWVIHDSVLPRHRGCAPVAHGILAGDREFGVTLFEATGKPDQGPRLQQRVITPPANATAREIQVALIPKYYEVVYHELSGGCYNGSFEEENGPNHYSTITPALRARDYDVRKRTST